MEIISVLALILLTLVGYSAGATVAAARPGLLPRLSDLGVSLLLWALALLVRLELGKWWALAAGFGLGLGIGAALGFGRRGADKASSVESVPEPPMPLWKKFSLRMGNFQGRMIMAFFYFIVVGPFAFLSRTGGDVLGLRRGEGHSWWGERTTDLEPELDKARRQF